MKNAFHPWVVLVATLCLALPGLNCAGAPEPEPDVSEPAASPEAQPEPAVEPDAQPDPSDAGEPDTPEPDAGPEATDAGTVDDAGTSEPEPESMVDFEAAKDAAEEGLRVVTLPSQHHQAYTTLALELIVEASLLNDGALTTNGTLSADGDALTYSPTPADALVLDAGGDTLTLRVTTATGDFTAGADSFLMDAHSLAFTVELSDVIDATIISQSADGVNATRSISGSVVDDGRSFSVNVQSVGTVLAQVEPGGQLYEAADAYAGSVSADDFAATYSEAISFSLINVENFVTNKERTFNLSWTTGTNHFAMEEGWLRTSYVNGAPAEFDYWRAEGELSRNSNMFGELALNETDFAVDVVLVLDDEQRVLESHPK